MPGAREGSKTGKLGGVVVGQYRVKRAALEDVGRMLRLGGTRVRQLEAILRRGRGVWTVKEMAEETEVSKPSLLKTVRDLERREIVRFTRIGRGRGLVLRSRPGRVLDLVVRGRARVPASRARVARASRISNK